MKLGLGTAQFGMDYGISNKDGKTSFEESGKIIALAAKEGFKVIDTAPMYGDSESVLGRLFVDVHGFNIVTKIPKVGKQVIGDDDVRSVEQAFMQSLKNLKQPSVYGLLMHHPEDLLAQNGSLIFDKLVSFKEKGIVNKIGISAYSKEQIDKVLSVYSKIDLIQVPVNVLDQRLINGGYLGMLKKNGLEVHSRSVFLQGLLLMDPDMLINFPLNFRAHLKKVRLDMKNKYQNVERACLAFVLGNNDIDAVICGVNSEAQLNEIIKYSHGMDIGQSDFSGYAINDESILNPSNWDLL